MVIDDIVMLRNFIDKFEKQNSEKNNLTDYSSGNSIFPWTNEALRYYYEKNLDGKKVLTVTSSGDHLLHAALAGATDITAFDINRFCKYYSALKVAMIKKYSYIEFTKKTKILCECFSDDIYNSRCSFSVIKHILKDVKRYLSEDEYNFWKSYINLNDDKERLFFVGYKYSEVSTYNAYFDEKQYLKLKQNLNSCKIRYVDSGIDNLKYKLGDKYDVIYLSNILSIIFPGKRNEIAYIISLLSTLLKEDGTIYDYHFNSMRKDTFEAIQKEICQNNNFYIDCKEIFYINKHSEVYSYKKKNRSN